MKLKHRDVLYILIECLFWSIDEIVKKVPLGKRLAEKNTRFVKKVSLKLCLDIKTT